MQPLQLDSWRAKRQVLAKHILESAHDHGPLRILEAGCGSRWNVDLGDLEYTLTGVDLDEKALDMRVNERHDLHEAIVGDLRTVVLDAERYDIVYCCNVLEHVDGAEQVMHNLVRWTRPGGTILVLIPDGRSAKGFLTKLLPHWVHVLFVRHVQGLASAGKTGFGPYRTYFDPVVSLGGVRRFCAANGLTIDACYSSAYSPSANRILTALSQAVAWTVHIVSFGRLTARHADLMFVIRKPEDPAGRHPSAGLTLPPDDPQRRTP